MDREKLQRLIPMMMYRNNAALFPADPDDDVQL